MSPSLSTSSFNQDADGNIGVAIHSQSGTVRRVPSVTASLNIDEDGNVGVFGLGVGNGGAQAQVDLTGILDANVPFNSIVFRPTSPAFNITYTTLVFGRTTNPVNCVRVIFTNTTSPAIALTAGFPSMTGRSIPGMWVRVTNREVTPNIDQLIRVTDETNILIPEVRLSDLAGERELSLTSITSGIGISSPNNIAHGILGLTNPFITSIDGCEFLFRMTHAQAIEYLSKTKTMNMTQSQYNSLTEPTIADIPQGTLIAIT